MMILIFEVNVLSKEIIVLRKAVILQQDGKTLP